MFAKHLLGGCLGLFAIAALAIVGSGRLTTGHAAAPSYRDITSAGPLAHIHVGDDLSCQAGLTGVDGYAMYPADSELADCGTFVVVDGQLYAPDFAQHSSSDTGALGAYEPFTAMSQSAISGNGTAGSPYRVLTVVDAGTTGVRISQTDIYVAGTASWRTDIQVAYTGAGTRDVLIYRGTNCVVGGTSVGYGALDAAAGRAACSLAPNNLPAEQFVEFAAITPAQHVAEGPSSEIWTAIGTGAPLPDTCACVTEVDHAIALQWSGVLLPGASLQVAHQTTVFATLPIAVTKSADAAQSEPGTRNGYRITISNPNAAPVDVSAIEDTLPARFSYVAGSTTGVTTSEPLDAGGTLTWWGPFTVPGAGAVVLDFGVTVSSVPGMYTNSATVSTLSHEVVPFIDGAMVVVGDPPTPTVTPTGTATATNTPLPPSSTPTRTATATNTPLPPSSTPTRTATATNTPLPPSSTPTRTATATNTPLPPSTTPTRTATATNTPLPPSSTPTRTATATNTPLPPSTTPTRTATATNTPLPPSSTPTRTATATATPTSAAPAPRCADVTGDGRVTLADVFAIVRRLGARAFDARYDLNRDGRITGQDVVLALRQLGRRC